MSGEYYRLLAKIIIQIQRHFFKECPEYFFFCNLFVEDFSVFVMQCHEKNYSWEYIRTICNHHFDCNQYYYCISYGELMELYPYQSLDDSTEIEKICLKAMEEQPQAVADYKKGKLNSINRLKGQVMKATAGKVNVKVVDETLQRLLK